METSCLVDRRHEDQEEHRHADSEDQKNLQNVADNRLIAIDENEHGGADKEELHPAVDGNAQALALRELVADMTRSVGLP